MLSHYRIPADTETGRAVAAYFERCRKCEQAARDFIHSLPDTYGYLPVDDDTEYIGHINPMSMQPDVEAGGVAILVAPSVEGGSTSVPSIPNLKFWRQVSGEDGTLYYLPRMTRETRYVALSHAKSIIREDRIGRWDFRRESNGSLRVVTYESISSHLLPKDKEAIAKAAKSAIIPPKFKLAIARLYTLDFDDQEDGKHVEAISISDYTPEEFQLARRLREEMDALPVVPNGTLANTLGLSLPKDIKATDAKLHYNYMDPSDANGKSCINDCSGDLLISTNLEFTNPDILPR